MRNPKQFLTQWRTQRRHDKQAQHQKVSLPLREFVYLDEVSVTSLVASQGDGVPETLTRTEGSAFEAEIKATTEVNAAIAKSGVESRLTSHRQQESQVVSKAVIQSLFKQLHTAQRDRLLIRPTEPDDESALGTAREGALSKVLAPWRLRADELERGRLVEIDVVLRPEKIFEATTAISTFIDIAAQNQELTAALGSGLDDATGVYRILEHLLAGLVPIRGEAVDYVIAVETDGTEQLVHKRLLAARGLTDIRPLEIVAVTEERLYWRDLRRVLFSGAQVRMLCRISRGGLHTTWESVKLLDVFRVFDNSLSDQLHAALDFTLNPAASAGAAGGDEPERRLVHALELYRSELLSLNEIVEDGADVSVEPFAAGVHVGESVERRRERFTALTAALELAHGFTTDRSLVATLRSAASSEAGLIGPWHPEPAQEAAPASHVAEPQSRLLDVDVVALYW